MKEQKHQVIVNGTPKLENMPKEAFNVFCGSLLREVEEYYKEQKPQSNNSTQSCENGEKE